MLLRPGAHRMDDAPKPAGSASGPLNVLFLCTGNSARSVIAEAILNRVGAGRFAAWSAGSMPKSEVHPQTIKLLGEFGYDVSGFRSKSWGEFAAPAAPKLDFIITVCDNAAGEVCPIWPGRPITAHWGIPDPAAVEGSPAQIAAAFGEAYQSMLDRIEAFCRLPIESLNPMAVKREMDKIGRKVAPPKTPNPAA